MNIDVNKYYDYRQKVLGTYDKSLNFIIGGRGIGKTYGFKKDCISRYKKNGATVLNTEYSNDTSGRLVQSNEHKII